MITTTTRKVYKYAIPANDHIFLDMPEGAKILSFQTQQEQPTIWALVDPDAPTERRHFRMFGTGHPISHSTAVNFIGTCQMMGGALVWHLFEIGR